LAARAHTPEDLDQELTRHHWRRGDWHGVRIFTDHRDDDAPHPDELLPLLEAEHEAGRRDPYRQVAALLHIIYRRH
jgi:S-adenosylmethionine-dependent methyltransferase